MKYTLALLLILLSFGTFGQGIGGTIKISHNKPPNIDYQNDTLLITNPESVKYIKIGDEVYRINIELQKVHQNMEIIPIMNRTYNVDPYTHGMGIPYQPLRCITQDTLNNVY